MDNKFIIFFVLFAAGFFAANIAMADDPHGYKAPRTVYVDSQGVASAISAAQCHFDGGSYDLQLCGGWGHSYGQDAYTVGAGQKIGDFLLNYTETTENGNISRGAGINWKIKFK